MSLNLTLSQIKPSKPIQYSSNTAFLKEVDLLRLKITSKIDKVKQQEWGQFFTPFPVADLMARMFQNLNSPEISLLDAGAGIGSLSAAFVSTVCQQPKPPDSLRIIAYEIDPSLKDYLKQTLELCTQQCESYKISLHWEIRTLDFIEEGVNQLQPNLFSASENLSFTHAIINPPYFKINAHSKYRSLLRSINLETSNIYPGFIQVATQLLSDGGELVAITPRSFCNGLYFREFRKRFLRDMALRQVHLFDSRLLPFNDQAVLQETMIFSAIKQIEKESTVLMNSSCSADDDLIRTHTVPYTTVVHPDDSEQFIRIVPDVYSQEILEQMASFQCTLLDLGLCVSTGRVVDFRAKEYLRLLPEAGTVPLIYPVHCSKGYLEYPTSTQKHQALVQTEQTANLLVPNEHYVLTRRFSAKEEKKRVVAVVYDANSLNSQWVGFENHLNYFHHQGKGLPLSLARGLTAYLNSTLVDSFFRLFNGNTQVNATDLRNLKYPTLEQLLEWGEKIGNSFPSQQSIDELIQQDILKMTNSRESNPIDIKSHIDEALSVLEQLGFPTTQRNERSALTLLALLNLKPNETWQSSTSPLMGITPIMEFMAQHYGKTYKPNTRETVRRQTIHQFLDAALIRVNPDQPLRAINSPKTVYQIEDSALELLRTYGTPEWEQSLKTYQASVQTLKQRYANERQMARIPIVIEGEVKTLSPGGQNVLIEKIIHEFAPRFTPEGKLLYVGDTDEKFAYFNEDAITELGIQIDSHGKMPDVIIHFIETNWLILIEAVTSHGPINAKRKNELENLFKNSTIPLVMVTAFLK